MFQRTANIPQRANRYSLLRWFHGKSLIGVDRVSEAMNRRIAVGILVIVSLSIGVVYGIRTYVLTQSTGGFPGGTTNIWVLGSNSTLASNIPNPPPVGSNGTLPLYTTNVKITCGGANT